MRVLVTDDEAITRGALERALTLAGHEVVAVAVADGRLALDALRRSRIRMVVCDWTMPHMSGIELCRAIRASDLGRYVYIIMLTGRDRPRDVVEGLDAGADDFVTKPFNPREILCRIRSGERLLELETAEATIAEMDALNKKLAQNTVEMEEFVYSVSHDLKSPIVTQIGFLGCIREDLAAGDHDAVLASTDRLERATRRMQRCIEDLLEVSRIGRVGYETETVDVGAVVDEVAADLSDRLHAAGAVLTVERDLPTVTANRTHVAKVFANLIGNAIKYGCDHDGATVVVGSERAGDEQRLFVRDEGPGIDPAYHAKVFGLFQRLQAEKREGSGVGLAIVKRTAEVHGGRAWVESNPGEGATFWIALPHAAACDTDAAQSREVTPSARAVAVPHASDDAQPIDSPRCSTTSAWKSNAPSPTPSPSKRTSQPRSPASPPRGTASEKNCPPSRGPRYILVKHLSPEPPGAAVDPRTPQFVKLLAAAQTRLYAYIMSMVGHPDAAEDILQETYLVLWQKMDEALAAENFNAWAYAVARFQVLAHQRDRGRDRHVFDEDLLNVLAEESVPITDRISDDRVALEQCLRKLTAPMRDLITQRYEHNRATADIAEDLGKSVPAVTKALYRTRMTLLACIEKTKTEGGPR